MRTHLKIAACFVWAATFVPKSAPVRADDSRPQAQRLEAIERAVDAKRDELHVVGAALAIVKDDRIIYLKGLGRRDLERDLPVTPDTLFAVGSTTKAFTAATVLMSQEEGKLTLADSPRKYLPYFKLQDPEADQKITISDLLCHRSGLNRTDIAWYTGKLKPAEIIRVACDAKPTARFGEKFQYQNVMFLTAGEIVSKVQKQLWSQFVARRIFAPLGMARTNTSTPAMLLDNDHALGYQWSANEKRLINLPTRDLGCIAPAGAINSSARDMAQWVRLMLGGGAYEGKRLLSPDSFKEIAVERIKIAPTVGYGYGWFLRDWHGHKVMEHGGNIDGFTAEVALMPDQHLGFVLLTNANVTPLGANTMDIVWNELVGAPESKPLATPDPGAGLASAAGPPVPPEKEAGQYEKPGAPAVFDVSWKDDKLVLTAPAQPPYPLSPIGGRKYKLGPPAPDGFFITFRPSKEDPNATEALIEQPQGNVVLKRKETPPYAGKMTVDELMRKTVEALGGESNLKKCRAATIRYRATMEDQGVTVDGTEYFLAPDRHLVLETLTAAGRRVATTREYFDGKRGGEEDSFTRPEIKTGSALADAAVDARFAPEREWKTLFKTVAIKSEDKVNDEPVYVIELKPEKGTAITEYISQTSFLPVKRQRAAQTTTFTDWRGVDGIKVPYSRTITSPAGGRVVLTVREVRFNGSLHGLAFGPKATATALARRSDQIQESAWD